MLSVLKIGGSVLRDVPSFGAVAAFLRERLEAEGETRLVVIVSAPQGMTDALLHEATSIVADVERAARTPLDLLWSTGELRSVALLTLHLRAGGVEAVPFNVHQAGLIASDDVRGSCGVHPLRLLAALREHRLVIVPGFLATTPGGAITSLGRGGSDLTAVLIATALHADRCELIKDVAGYYTADPNRTPDARPVRDLPAAAALAMARGGCDLVQYEALAAADRAALPLIVRSLDAAAPLTTVHPSRRSSHGVCDEDHSRRPAIGARDRRVDRADFSDVHLRTGGPGAAPGI